MAGLISTDLSLLFLMQISFFIYAFLTYTHFFKNTTRPWCLDALNSEWERSNKKLSQFCKIHAIYTYTLSPSSVYSLPDFKHSLQRTCYTWRHFVNSFPKIIYRFKYYHPIALNVCDSYQTQVNTVRLIFFVWTKTPIWEYTVS